MADQVLELTLLPKEFASRTHFYPTVHLETENPLGCIKIYESFGDMHPLKFDIHRPYTLLRFLAEMEGNYDRGGLARPFEPIPEMERYSSTYPSRITYKNLLEILKRIFHCYGTGRIYIGVAEAEVKGFSRTPAHRLFRARGIW